MDKTFWLVAIVIMAAGSLPVWIAYARHHPARGWIGLVCVLTGWTGYAWLIALVWSLLPFRKLPEITVTEVDFCRGCNPRWPAAIPGYDQKLARLELLYDGR
ncbi:Membrane protein (modular protein) [Rhodospirillaceae bacterium LM-1]|nr:Membrane protein (modular protein) [Rhodospirillaceae bacterium LM-1]